MGDDDVRFRQKGTKKAAKRFPIYLISLC